jgi:hypothetical protein
MYPRAEGRVVLVTGDRGWDDRPGLWAALDAEHAANPFRAVTHGAARGADTASAHWSMDRLGGHHAHPARWRELGKAAGPIRNQEMLDDPLKPDVVVAFHDHLGSSRGTKDMVMRALKADLPVKLVAHRRYTVSLRPAGSQVHKHLTATVIVRGQDIDERPLRGGSMAMWRSTAAQTANNDAAAVVGRAIQAGQLDVSKKAGRTAALELFDEVRDHVMENLEGFLSTDDENYAESEDRGPGKKRGKASGRKGKRSSKTGGGKGKGSKKFTLEDALELELNFGAFEGETLETVLNTSAEDADENYSYGDGERDGRDYIAWLASDSNRNKFVRGAAKVIAEDEGIELDED